MKSIIDALKKLLKESRDTTKVTLQKRLVENLKSEAVTWVENYPVRLEHDKKSSVESYTLAQLQELNNVPTVDLMALTQSIEKLEFSAKRPHDFWKRLSSVDHIKAMVSLLEINPNECEDAFIDKDVSNSAKGQWRVETVLRDTMRANKENRDLGIKPFIVVLSKKVVEEETDHLYAMLKHYFKSHVEHVLSQDGKTNYYIGFHEHMGEMGMRYFYRFKAQ